MTPAATRRGFLAGAGIGLAALLDGCAGLRGADPFTLGVASGDPTPDGVVLWTRLAPDPLSPDPSRPGGMVPEPAAVRWELAEDESFRRIVRNGTVTALPEEAHSVHVELGGLLPARDYWYRFTTDSAASPIGRTRTAPQAGAPTDRLRFAFASCSNYELGHFASYRHMAEEQPDLVLFLGDYIYEHISPRKDKVRLHSDGVAATDLRTYRNRYAQYRTDPALRAVHAAAPSLAIWDDHEVEDDYADRWSKEFVDPAAFLQRRAAAYQAFWEHMPLRRAAKPVGPNATIYGRFGFGDLAEITLLDGRQYRSRLACDAPPKGGGKYLVEGTCPERLDPGRSMLGREQESWLYSGFARSPARWNVIAQDVMMAPLLQHNRAGQPGHWSDAWEGYAPSRQRLLRAVHESRLANPVVLSGDIHSFWANDLHLDDRIDRPVVASELVGSSISSVGPDYKLFASWLPDNPQVHYFESRRRGYVSVDLRRDRMDVSYRAVADVRDPNAGIETLKRFVVEDRRPGVQIA